MVVVIGTLFLVNGLMAWLTAKDAYTRGKHASGWFCTVLVFSVFGAICYLLIRPDQRLQPAERQRSRSDRYLASVFLYGSTTVGGFVVGIILAGVLTPGLGVPAWGGAGVQFQDVLIAGTTVGPPTSIFALGGRAWLEAVLGGNRIVNPDGSNGSTVGDDVR